MEMFRREINLHLTRCPASVLVCMAEWNREFLALVPFDSRRSNQVFSFLIIL